ncbi:MAG: bifunctional 5,10-methylenetetrahydrofolate dehydrogenase/5,10-methenyltetrahydrofolate cyclohydrolase [Patescibacteria group bacterium]
MTAQIVNGKEIAKRILEEIKEEITQKKLELTLGIIKISNDQATDIYIRNKIKRANECGIKVELKEFSETVQEAEVLDQINKFNDTQVITGFFIQTPIAKHLNLTNLTEYIDPKKDVDGMTSYNLGGLLHNRRDILVSATAVACYSILKFLEADLVGKHAVIVGRSLIVGKPLFALLLAKDCTVTLCHSKTQNLQSITKTADILISSTGREKLITKNHIKEGAFVIDCGSPKGEVAFDSAVSRASHITPVPGGVGPVTIACLLKNTLKAYGLQKA